MQALQCKDCEVKNGDGRNLDSPRMKESASRREYLQMRQEFHHINQRWWYPLSVRVSRGWKASHGHYLAMEESHTRNILAWKQVIPDHHNDLAPIPSDY